MHRTTQISELAQFKVSFRFIYFFGWLPKIDIRANVTLRNV